MRRCIIHYLPVFPSQFSSYQTLTYAAPDSDPVANMLPAPQNHQHNPSSNAEYYDPRHWEQQEGEPEVRSRIPLIVLAQKNSITEVPEPDTPRIMRPALSTITERTERTEATPRWRSGFLNTNPPLSSAPTSSYGEVIGVFHSVISFTNTYHLFRSSTFLST